MLHFLKVRSLAAAIIATAIKDLLDGRETAKALSWVNGSPAALTFAMACHWLDISPQEARQRLQAMAANPDARDGRGRYWQSGD